MKERAKTGGRWGKRLLTAGILCAAAAAALFVYNKVMDVNAGQFSQRVVGEIKDCIARPSERVEGDGGKADGSPAPSMAEGESEQQPGREPAQQTGDASYAQYVQVEGYSFMGYLTIPDLGLELPVMSDWNYDKLNISPCRYAGSVVTRDLVIAAHNYDSHFGAIGSLREGAEVIFTNTGGDSFHYSVALIDTLNPVEINKMTAGEYDLSLFTCTLSGTARVTVRCVFSAS